MSRLSRVAVLLCSSAALAAAATPATRMAEEAMARLPLRFEANQGQLDPEVRYAARSGATTLLLTRRGPSLSLSGSRRIDISFEDGNRAPKIEALDPLPTRTNYFIGSPDRGRTAVPSFARVRYQSVYPGIDLVYYGNRSQLEYDL